MEGLRWSTARTLKRQDRQKGKERGAEICCLAGEAEVGGVFTNNRKKQKKCREAPKRITAGSKTEARRKGCIT